jgi:hypothetical protein
MTRGREMRRYTAEQRQRFAEMLSNLANEWIVEREAEFDLEFQRGVQWCRNTATGDRTPRSNPTFTLTLTINGGAQDTEGAPIVPSPGLFRGPAG